MTMILLRPEDSTISLFYKNFGNHCFFLVKYRTTRDDYRAASKFDFDNIPSRFQR